MMSKSMSVLMAAGLMAAGAIASGSAKAADTEIVLEGVIRCDETVREGPFGEFVGYLAQAEEMPIVEVTALTHRRRPVYHAINGYGRETIESRFAHVTTLEKPVGYDELRAALRNLCVAALEHSEVVNLRA